MLATARAAIRDACRDLNFLPHFPDRVGARLAVPCERRDRAVTRNDGRLTSFRRRAVSTLPSARRTGRFSSWRAWYRPSDDADASQRIDLQETWPTASARHRNEGRYQQRRAPTATPPRRPLTEGHHVGTRVPGPAPALSNCPEIVGAGQTEVNRTNDLLMMCQRPWRGAVDPISTQLDESPGRGMCAALDRVLPSCG
jgi:hypothetical protein